MDKEFLGLGIAFKGIDKGLNESLDDAVSNFDRTTDSIKQVEKAANAGGKEGGIFSNLIEGVQLLSLGRIGSSLEEMSQGISGTERTANDLFKTLDKLDAKFSQTFDPNVGTQLRMNIMGIMETTAVTADQAETLALGMTNFGRSVNEVNASLPFMGKLVGTLGLDAEKVAMMFGQGLSTLRATPDQMKNLIEETVKLQKSYNLTGQVEVLPELFESVTKNAARFGQVNADAAIRSTMGLQRMVAAFQKVGKSQADAVSATVGFNDKIGEIRVSMRRWKVGLGDLGDDFGQLHQALAEAGVADPFATIEKGLENPEQLMETVGKQIEGLGDFQKTRVTELLRDVFGDDVTNLLTAYRDEAQAAVEQAGVQAEKLGDADVEFNKLEKAMRGTVDFNERMVESTQDLVDVTLGFVNKTKIVSHLQNQRKALIGMSDAIEGQASKWENLTGKVMSFLELFRRGGLAAIFDSEALAGISVFSEKMGSLIFPLTSLLGIFTLFKGPLAIFGKLLTAPFRLLGKVVLAPLGLLSKGLMTMIGQSKLSGAAMGAFGKATKAMGAVWEHIYVSMGSRLIDFTKSVKTGLSTVMNFAVSSFKAIGKGSLSLITGPFKLLKNQVVSLGSVFKGGLLKMGSGFKFLGGQILSSLAGPIKSLKILGLQMLNVAATGVKQLMGSMARLGSSLLAFSGRAVATAIGAVQALTAAMLANPVGLIIAGVVALGAALVGLVVYWDDVKAAVSRFGDWISTNFPRLTSLIINSWNSIQSAIQTSWNFTIGFFKTGWDFIKNIFVGGFEFISSLVEIFRKTGSFVAVWSLIKEKASAAWDAIKMKITETVNSISSFFGGIGVQAASAWQSIVNAFSFESLRKRFESVFDFASLIQQSFEKEGAVGVFDFLIEEGTKAMGKLVDMMTEMLKSIPVPDFLSDFLFGKNREKKPDKTFAEARQEILATDNVMPTKDKDLLPDNVIPMPMPNMAFQPSPVEGEARITPQVNQIGAPPRAREPLSIPSESRMAAADQNFQDLIKEVQTLRSDLLDVLEQLVEKDVSIKIQGDMKKILQVVRNNERYTAGERGIGHAVNR